ncbi:hypothetical protein BN946_scf184690.g2 [Trametes cinnabarina]|uniref:DNA 3'-5' helicase n=1 Tax=Pycnoporus cinnabarinus TaxID=5643 RepID=A0A060SUS8_PYCCI|nr:hypothetical protein BN946_scf184690.g2 [Trametes cinnabarina]
MPLPPRWSTQRIRDVVYTKFGKRVCLFQIRIARALREQQKDVVAVAATGAGKTLSFWIALLMALEDGEDKMVIVVTPLNLLGKQNADVLTAAGMSAVAVDAQNSNNKTFDAIEAGEYRVVVLSPEIIMQNGGRCEELWTKASFTAKIMYMVFDEGHCITEWSGFREDYKHVGILRRLISTPFPFLIPSATLPALVLRGVRDTMLLRKGHTEYLLRSNDRPEIAIAVRRMQYSASSFKDLDWISPAGYQDGDPLPPRFLLFCNTIKLCEAITIYLNNRLPLAHRGKIRYFHSVMTPHYRVDEYAKFRDHETLGLCVTDAFGMGLDLPDPLPVRRAPIDAMDVDDADNVLAVNEDAGVTGDEEGELEEGSEPEDGEVERAESIGQPADSERIQSDVGTELASTGLDEERRTQYNESAHKTPSSARAGRKENKVVELPLDDLVNADRRGFGCRRKPLLLYYSNDHRSFDHQACDPTTPSGCSRCSPKTTIICCDLCDPTAFEHILSPATSSAAARKMKKSSIKPYDSTPLCESLRKALIGWRNDRAVQHFGRFPVQNFGSNLFLPLTTLNRLVDCAQAGKVVSLDSLKKEIVWQQDFFEQYGTALLDLIHSHFPLPIPTPPAVISEPVLTAQLLENTATLPAGPDAQCAPSEGSTRKRKQPTCQLTGSIQDAVETVLLARKSMVHRRTRT